MVHRFPTPKTTTMGGCSGAREAINRNPNLSKEEKRSMNAGNYGSLNPDWVEWLMGIPAGFTDSDNNVPTWYDWQKDPADKGVVPRLTMRKDLRKARLKALGNAQVPLCAFAMLFWGLILLNAFMDSSEEVA